MRWQTSTSTQRERLFAPKTVQSVVEGYYNISHEDMIGRKRQKTIAFARHVAIYLVNDMCDVLNAQAALGAVFGQSPRHHRPQHQRQWKENFGRMLILARSYAQLKNKIILKS